MSTSTDFAAERPLIATGLYSYRIGGSERIGSELAMAYASRGYRVVCFAFHGSTGPFRDRLEGNGIECLDLNYLNRPRLVRRMTYPLELYRFFRGRGVRALHVHHAMALTHCGRAARLAGIRHVVMTEHAIFQFQRQPGYRRTAARHCRFATAIAGVHSGITDYFRDQFGVPADRLHVIPNGVAEFRRDAEARRRTRSALGIDESTFACLYVGRLAAVKDLPTLLKAAARLRATSGGRIRVLLAGGGPEQGALESLCRSLNASATVTFLGERSDIADLLNMADAFVMTSSTEGLPMALIEAMAAGLPCVATAVGGIPAVLSDGAGLLAPAGDPDAVGDAIARLASDNELRRKTAENALRKVRSTYGLEPVVTAYLKLLGLPERWPGT